MTVEPGTWMGPVFLLVAYLIGSVPFGLVVSRIFSTKDLREHGSGNIGATNMVRVGGKKLGALVLLLDGGKGWLAVWLAQLGAREGIVPVEWVAYAALAAVIGHCFPLWLRFKGGKGVATAFGVLFPLHVPLGLAAALVWVVIYLKKGISSLSALVAMALMILFAWAFEPLVGVHIPVACTLISLLVIARHHENIRRLLRGEEGRKAKEKPDDPRNA